MTVLKPFKDKRLRDRSALGEPEHESTVQAVEDGFGISVLPYCLIEEYLKEGRLAEIKVEDLCLERNLNLVYHPHKVWNDPLRDFMDIVRWYGHDEIRAMKTTDGMFHGQTDTNTLLL